MVDVLSAETQQAGLRSFSNSSSSSCSNCTKLKQTSPQLQTEVMPSEKRLPSKRRDCTWCNVQKLVFKAVNSATS